MFALGTLTASAIAVASSAASVSESVPDNYNMGSIYNYSSSPAEDELLLIEYGPYPFIIWVAPYDGSVAVEDHCVQTIYNGPSNGLDSAPWGSAIATLYNNDYNQSYFGPTDNWGESEPILVGEEFLHYIKCDIEAWSQDGENETVGTTGQRVRKVEDNLVEFKNVIGSYERS